jgi:hypothetical protein
MQSENVNEVPELLLMEGGPGDALMKRLRLIRPELGEASARTAIILAAITWIPLLAFSFVEGLALGGAKIPFLYDIAAHARFLVAVPIGLPVASKNFRDLRDSQIFALWRSNFCCLPAHDRPAWLFGSMFYRRRILRIERRAVPQSGCQTKNPPNCRFLVYP